MRRLLALALALAPLACGRSGAINEFLCVPFAARELNATTGSCLGPPVSVDGLTVCQDPNEAQGHSLTPLCAVAPSGRLFVGQVSSTQWFEGNGWRFSAAYAASSTLSTTDEARCKVALSTTTPTCQ